MLYNQFPRVDRFVGARDRLYTLQRRLSWHVNCSDYTNPDTWDTKYLRQKKYANYLDDAFGIEPVMKETPVPADNNCVQYWPCIPRKKSYLSSGDGILDLPSYKYATFPELLDWSYDNILVAALDVSYHKWSWWSQSLIGQGLTRSPIQCCKFDPRGELLTLGTEDQILEIHDNERSMKISVSYCKCMEMHNYDCAITAIDWSPTGNSFATGCDSGTVVSYSRSGQLISWREVSPEAIFAVRVSPDARYIATSSLFFAIIYLLVWPSLQLHSVLNADWAVQTITWHPWRSALLGVGTVTSNTEARVTLWNAANSKRRDWTLGHKKYDLDAMLFSRRSGELVVSLRSVEDAKRYSELVVLSDPDTVVDQCGGRRYGLDRVRTMVFSPDGTKLATATAGEDLIIWNFLPEDKMRKKLKCKKFFSMPVYIDEAKHPWYSLR